MSKLTNTHAPSIKELVPIVSTNNGDFVNARNLHHFLKVKTDFSDWITRKIEEYKFEENIDFSRDLKFEVSKKGTNLRSKVVDYNITIDMAKELSMVEKNEMGRMARKYFIEIEKMYREQGYFISSEPEKEGYFKGCCYLYHKGIKFFVSSEVAKLGIVTKSQFDTAKKKLPGAFFKMFGRNFISASYANYLVEKNNVIIRSNQLELDFFNPKNQKEVNND